MGALARTAHASRHGELAPSYQHRDFGATDAGRLHDNGFLARLGRGGYIRALQPVGVWRSLVAHRVRDAGVAGSNPATPTNTSHLKIRELETAGRNLGGASAPDIAPETSVDPPPGTQTAAPVASRSDGPKENANYDGATCNCGSLPDKAVLIAAIAADDRLRASSVRVATVLLFKFHNT